MVNDRDLDAGLENANIVDNKNYFSDSLRDENLKFFKCGSIRPNKDLRQPAARLAVVDEDDADPGGLHSLEVNLVELASNGAGW
jgi:hypothetical protein